jgi:asparagine synthase (glutamine-hydrolysing)
MAAIAGIARSNAHHDVNQMLDRMAHRGPNDVAVKTINGATIGIRWPDGQPDAAQTLDQKGAVEDYVSDSHFAQAKVFGGSLVLTRDPLGASPLYYGYTAENDLCFASEVKALLGLVDEIFEVPPGVTLKDGAIQPQPREAAKATLSGGPEDMALELRRRLENSIEKRASRGVPFGSWLSGGLDSSIMAALSRPYIEKLHTFAAGFEGAPDLEYAQMVADHIDSTHHEMIPTFDDVVEAIPEVIYHLESFDALLVRSSLMNYLVARMASDYVPAVFSGEGADELFAGYDYLKEVSLSDLPAELIDITNRLHNTALQRVDRCASAHATVAYVGFLDQNVVDYANQIPAEFKIHDGMEKWILRQSVQDALPDEIVYRGKAKFWEGAGVEEQISQYASERVSDEDFRKDRQLPNGDTLNTKEELFYYRVFQEHFGSLENLDCIGRTKGSPVQ